MKKRKICTRKTGGGMEESAFFLSKEHLEAINRLEELSYFNWFVTAWGWGKAQKWWIIVPLKIWFNVLLRFELLYSRDEDFILQNMLESSLSSAGEIFQLLEMFCELK